jgi:hypothetical protein
MWFYMKYIVKNHSDRILLARLCIYKKINNIFMKMQLQQAISQSFVLLINELIPQVCSPSSTSMECTETVLYKHTEYLRISLTYFYKRRHFNGKIITEHIRKYKPLFIITKDYIFAPSSFLMLLLISI